MDCDQAYYKPCCYFEAGKRCSNLASYPRAIITSYFLMQTQFCHYHIINKIDMVIKLMAFVRNVNNELLYFNNSRHLPIDKRMLLFTSIINNIIKDADILLNVDPSVYEICLKLTIINMKHDRAALMSLLYRILEVDPEHRWFLIRRYREDVRSALRALVDEPTTTIGQVFKKSPIGDLNVISIIESYL